MLDRLASMAVYVRVCDTGSFASAAASLGVSAQMVGRHVQSLEQRLGVRLINRSTRSQSVTDIGRTFLERCRTVLAEVDAAETGAMESRATPRGHLRIDAPVTFGEVCLARVLPDYLKANPEVTIDLTLNNRYVDLIEEGFDAVIRTGRLPDSSLISHKLAPYRFIACAAPAYLAAYGEPQSPQDLTRHLCLGFAPGMPGAWTFETKNGKLTTIKVKGCLSSNNGEVLRQAAIAGRGIVLQPAMLIEDDVSAGRLVRILPDWNAPSWPVHVLHAPGRGKSPALRSLVDFLTTRFRHDLLPARQPRQNG